MKIFNIPVRVINNDTLETLGTYGSNQVMAKQSGEAVCTITNKDRLMVCGIIVLILFGFLGCIGMMASKTKSLENQLTHFEEVTGMNLPYISVEALAGKYATFKGAIPSDKDTVFKFICESGAWYPEVIMAQLQLESNYLTSDVGRNATNGFGMKKCGEGPKSRPNLQIQGMDYHGYGMYMNWYHSVLDRVLWDLWVFDKKPESREAYLQGLVNKRYAEDPDYLAKINQIAEEWAPKIKEYIDPDSPKDTVIGKP